MTKAVLPKGDDQLRLDSQVCFPLYAATNLLQRLYRPLLAPLGITYSQYLVMLVLWERNEVTVGELCHCLHLDVGTLSPMLKRMEAADLVTRRRDAENERRVLVTPTRHGAALYQRAREIPAQLAEQIDLTRAKAKELVHVRDKVRELLPKLVLAVSNTS